MKRVLAWILTVSMLLSLVGVMSTAAVAADEKATEWSVSVPAATVKVDSTGKVTVKVAGVDDKKVENAYAYVSPKDSTATTYVPLEYDKNVGGFVGTNAALADGTVRNAYLSKYNNEDNKYDSVSYSYSYNAEGKQNYGSYSESHYTSKEYEYEYKDEDGKTQKTKSYINTKYDYKYATEQYSTETGKMTYRSYNQNEYSGDNKTRDQIQAGRTQYFDSKTGNTTYDCTNSSASSKVFKANKYGGYNFIDETKKSTEEYRNYDSNNKYTGKTVYEYDYAYDTTGEYAIETNRESTQKSYNKDGVVTYESDGTTVIEYNSKKTEKTTFTYNEGKNFSKKGLLTQTSVRETTEKAKLNEETGDFVTQSSTSSQLYYNREDTLTSSNESEYKYDDKGVQQSSKTVYRTYNVFTGAMKTENITETKRNADDNLATKTSYTSNNDDGSQRYRYVNDYDNSTVRYNNANQVVASKSKDGTWSVSGKVIGKNDYDGQNGQTTSVWFKSRTGELSGYEVYNYTNEDGASSYERIEYDENGKQTSQYKNVNKADGSSERYEDNVLTYSYDAEKGVTKNFNSKGKLTFEGKWDEEKDAYVGKHYNSKGEVTYYDVSADGETTEYDAYDNKTYWYDNYGNEKWFDASGDVYKAVVMNDGVEEHYGEKDKLEYTKKYETKDDVTYTVYADGDGKEFARFYSSYKSEEKDDKYHSESVRQDTYKENGGYYEDEGWDYWWTPESQSGRIEKRTITTDRETKDDVTTETEKTDYVRWDVVDGKKTNEVTRNEKTESLSDDDHSEAKTYQDDVLVSTYYSEYNAYGENVKSTYTSYNAYTGKLQSISKWIDDDTPGSPLSWSKYYDHYGNLQTYSATDNTDQWDWTLTYFANGALSSEYWYDELDYDSSYDAYYYLNGNMQRESYWDENGSTSVTYNSKGNLLSTQESKDGVTNTTYYDGKGHVTGYEWNQKSEDGLYSYEVWDANKLLYTYSYGNDEDGYWMSSYVDPEGNSLTYKDGEGTELKLKQSGDGWRYAVGSWFYLENGEPVMGEWKKLGGTWYYFDWDGRMDTGLVSTWDYETDKTTVYALDENGALGTGGWVNMGNGGWAYTDANGVVQTGWQQIGGKWYYFQDGWTFNETDYKADSGWSQNTWNMGRMVTGAYRIWNADWSDKHTYFFNEDGSWDNSPGWKVTDGRNNQVEYHYYDRNGNEVTGWQMIGGKWYYFNEEGVMRNGWVKDGNTWYFMNYTDGSMANNGWVEDIYEDWYYMKKDGTMYTGWLQDGATWYYFNNSGDMASEEWVKSGNSWYYMTESGAMATGWVQDLGKWYYMNADGTMYTGWLQSGNDWYYLGSDGAMVTGEVTIDGQLNLFTSDGVWIGYGNAD